jgi:hypothetical protein
LRQRWRYCCLQRFALPYCWPQRLFGPDSGSRSFSWLLRFWHAKRQMCFVLPPMVNHSTEPKRGCRFVFDA